MRDFKPIVYPECGSENTETGISGISNGIIHRWFICYHCEHEWETP
jgi:hypothetical protein